MPTIYLVRHAKPAAGWGEDPDPGLDATGLTQAETAALALGERLDPLPVYTSPMRRCRETAAPLEQRWGRSAAVFAAVAEIPSPPLSLTARHEWLSTAMKGSWADMQRNAPPGSPDFNAWRQGLLQALATLPHDAVVFSHFIAINAVVGSARGDDAVVSFRPDHASVTVVQCNGTGCRIIDLGREAATTVLARA